jgi:hypothetical protein
MDLAALYLAGEEYPDGDLSWCYANTRRPWVAIHHLELYLQSTLPSLEYSEFKDQVESLWSAITRIRQQSG